jgi:hypothetical protein
MKYYLFSSIITSSPEDERFVLRRVNIQISILHLYIVYHLNHWKVTTETENEKQRYT